MSKIKYLIGVKKIRDGKWQYATEVSSNARFANADCAKKFDNIEYAKKWWDWSKNYFDGYIMQKPWADWGTLSVVKYVIEEEAAEKL